MYPKILSLVLASLFFSAAASGQPAESRRTDDAYRRYAEGIMKHYDKNKDNKLNATELANMRRPPKNWREYDQNLDLALSVDELLNSIKKKPSKNENKKTETSFNTVSMQVDLIRLPTNVDPKLIEAVTSNLSALAKLLEQEDILDLLGSPVNSISANVLLGHPTELNNNFWDDSGNPEECQIQVEIMKTHPMTAIRLELKKTQYSTNRDQPKTNAPALDINHLSRNLTKLELSQLLMEKISERRRESRSTRAIDLSEKHSNGSNRKEELDLQTVLICNENGNAAVFVSNETNNWIVHVRTKSVSNN